MSDQHIPNQPVPGWDELRRIRRMLEPQPLAHLSDEELVQGYERAQRLAALRAEAAQVEVPPEVASEVESLTDDELLAAWEELTT